MRPDQTPREDDGLDLGPFVAATRRELDGAARRQRLAGIPPAPSIPRRGPRVSLLVAAAVVLVGAAAVAATRGDLLSSGLRATAIEAEHQAQPRGPALASPRAEPAVLEPHAPPEELATPDRARVAKVEADPPPPAADPNVDTARAVEPHIADPAPTPARRSRSSLLAELELLDTEAQRRWRAGDLEGAEALFLEIVDKGGRTRYAELAFGDLFTLANQAGDPRREQQRWRRYLARFPRGRFADDVRAWQCRRASADDTLGCWRRYLDDWPRGTYRTEAKSALDPGGPR